MLEMYSENKISPKKIKQKLAIKYRNKKKKEEQITTYLSFICNKRIHDGK